MKPKPLAGAAVTRELAALPAWKQEGKAMRTFDRGNFDGSIAFVNDIATAANAADHHPDLTISWNEVSVRLSSHDAGGLTARDFALAKTIDRIAAA